MKITTRTVNALEGLVAAGFELKGRPIRGSIMVGYRNKIRVKHYAFRLRICDGHVLYRWGRLTRATITYLDDTYSHVVFHPEGDE